MNQKKTRVVVAFGAYTTSKISNQEPIRDVYGNIDGDLRVEEFDTEAEVNAYLKGLNDASGWLDYCVVASDSEEPDHPIFEGINSGLDVVEAYENTIRADRP